MAASGDGGLFNCGGGEGVASTGIAEAGAPSTQGRGRRLQTPRVSLSAPSPCHTPRSARPQAFTRLCFLPGKLCSDFLTASTLRSGPSSSSTSSLGRHLTQRSKQLRRAPSRLVFPRGLPSSGDAVSLPGLCIPCLYQDSAERRGPGLCLTRPSTGRAAHGPGTHTSPQPASAECSSSQIRGLASAGRDINLHLGPGRPRSMKKGTI